MTSAGDAGRRLRAALALSLILLCAFAAPNVVAAKELRGLLIRRTRDFKPKVPQGAPKFVKDLLKSDLVTKLFNLGFSKLKSVGTKGYYSLKWDTPDGLLGGILTDGVEAALPVLQKTLGVLGLEVYPDYGVNVSLVPDDAFWTDISANMDQIAATTAWDSTTGSSSVKVCVIDSGIQYTHPDLAGNMPGQLVYNSITDSVSTDSNNDASGHGTHVSGTIGAVGNNANGVAGVSWVVDIIGCKFLGSDGKGDLSDAVECIRWCREQGAKITSNSWGSDQPLDLTQIPGLHDEMKAAEDAGMLFVAAAGNEGLDVDSVDIGPGDIDLPSVINVGAVDSFDQMASFSNYGRSTVHLFAPGVDIASTYPTDSYSLLSGTSMACPHVSGTAALLWSTMPGATYADIKRAILAGVDIVDGAAESITGGRLNVANALRQLTDPNSPAPPPGAPPPPDATGGEGAPPPPLASGCTDQAASDYCSQWAAQGYCTGANVAYGQLVYVLCPATCNACGRCEDFSTDCPSYASQGYCSYYTDDGFSVSDVLCRSSCQSCGASVSSLSVPSLDISGVWMTQDQPNVYISSNLDSGRGYALWLENPPQTLRVQSLGANTWIMTDVEGGQYKITATSAQGDTDTLADTLTVGDSGEEVTWTRNTTADRVIRKHRTQAGDTLDSLAGQFNTTTAELTQLNPFLLLLNGTDIPANLPVVLPGSNFDGLSQLFNFSQSIFENQGSAAGTTSLPFSPPLTP